MSKERGAIGAVIGIVIGLGLIIAVISSFLLFGKQNLKMANQSGSGVAADGSDEIAVDSPATASLISFDPFVYTSPSGMYYRTHTPAPSGAGDQSQGAAAGDNANVGKYIRISGADPATFSEIKKIPIKNPTDTDSGAITQATYYRDSDQVFVAQTTVHETGNADTSVSEVTADPATFQILNDTYAKDATHVFVVSWVCEGTTCTLVLVVVVGADPATFHPIDATVVQKSDGTGTVTADAVDNSHLFNNGVIVDTVVTPGSNETDKTPVLISP